MLHLASCPKKYKDSASHLNQSHYDYQPLKTSYEKYSDDNNFHFANSGSNELDTDDSVSHTDSAFTISDNESVIHDKTNDDQCSTAVSKVQIKLNHLINRHKAPLKLYDDIVVLFNDYISSPNLDVYAKFKTRNAFIRTIDTSYSMADLRPMNMTVTLHDGKKVTVPVFDAKAMIKDILCN